VLRGGADYGRRLLPLDVEHFKARLLQDCLTEATASYWLHRAYQFQHSAPKGGDFNGQATPQQLAEQAEVCRQTELACRRHADLILSTYGEPISEDVWAVIGRWPEWTSS
jgi:hypothetical protein